MLRYDFPKCCTAKVIGDFNGATVNSIKKRIIQEMINSPYAIFTATTTDKQEYANAALTELGFKSSGWISKRQHPENKVKLWYKSVTSMSKKIKAMQKAGEIGNIEAPPNNW